MPNHFLKPRSWGKLLRYARLYGARRSAVKAAGRGAPIPSWAVLPPARGDANVSFIGCGQAAFGTLCYFLRAERGQSFLHAYDPVPAQAERLATFYGFEGMKGSADELLADPRLRTVYIASNHASHAGYAIRALNRGLDVFVEKPIATTWEDLQLLEAVKATSSGKLWAGYNRPFSQAISHVRELWKDAGPDELLTCHCRVQGHVIPSDHWYRAPEEGTRICGNAGHWLDLFVHLTAAIRKRLPDRVRIELVPENRAEPDDNYRLTVETERDTLILDFTSYREPREGVYEQLSVVCGTDSVDIHDFRSAKIFSGLATTEYYRPKDVGHRRCTLQPWLQPHEQRNLEEVWRSARLVLHAADLARRGGGIAEVDLSSTPPASFGAA